MTAIVAWQVFCRYVLNDSPSWTEPGAVILMSWFIFLGAAVGVRRTTTWLRRAALCPAAGRQEVAADDSDIVIFAFGLG